MPGLDHCGRIVLREVLRGLPHGSRTWALDIVRSAAASPFARHKLIHGVVLRGHALESNRAANGTFLVRVVA